MNGTHNITKFEYPTLELAWEGLNEYLINKEVEIRKRGGSTYGTEMVSYDNFIYIYKAFINPNYNFGRILGYRYKKWTKLLNNYVDMNYLDLVKSEVIGREKKKSSHYNFTFHFANAHGSGKDCLISLSFCRRQKVKTPYVIYTTRASEATSRLIFDFLLIQRIVEYVYGVENDCEVLCYIPFMFVNVERTLFYIGYKGRDIVDGDSPFQKRCLQKFDEFMTRDPDTIKYKVHKRSALQIQIDPKTGKPKSKCPDLYAKDLTLPFKPKYKEKDIIKLDKDLKG